HATGPTLDSPGHTFVGRRQQHHDCRVTALLDPGTGRGGLCVRLDEAHHYEIEAGDGEVRVVARIGPLRSTVARQPAPAGPLHLTVTVRTTGLVPASPGLTDGGTTGPDTIAFHLGGPGPPHGPPPRPARLTAPPRSGRPASPPRHPDSPTAGPRAPTPRPSTSAHPAPRTAPRSPNWTAATWPPRSPPASPAGSSACTPPRARSPS